MTSFWSSNISISSLYISSSSLSTILFCENDRSSTSEIYFMIKSMLSKLENYEMLMTNKYKSNNNSAINCIVPYSPFFRCKSAISCITWVFILIICMVMCQAFSVWEHGGDGISPFSSKQLSEKWSHKWNHSGSLQDSLCWA